MTDATPDPATILAQPVHASGESKPFASLTIDEVRERADELRQAVGFGPTVRVAPVARAWGELGRRMQAAEVATVADLDTDVIAELGPALWVVPPRGSLL